MIFYVLKRILATVPVMAFVAIFVFLLLRLTPGDPAVAIAGDQATEEQLRQIRAALSLDQPLLVQFVTWIQQIVRLDFGKSLISGLPVSELIAQRLEPTLSIALVTISMSVLVAVPLGVLTAWKQGSWIDRGAVAFSVLGFSIPVFVIAYMLIQLFAIDLRWLPVQGFAPLSRGLGPFLSHAILPSVVLSVIYVALIARMTRAAMLDVIHEDFVRTARAKGCTEPRVLFRHALRNAAIPILTVVGTGLALLISGVVVTESVFNLPGLGRLTIDAVMARDYPVIQAMILVTSAVYVLINLLIDLAYSLFDPRIKY
ncbi:ABC transporter permease [Chachezhania sediminis]|uniref:ABC transporter permease n=1 Tax=Chachezhania sediminis TaxID=2599291 RepID=UPI00131DE0E1|nr:ABC transporter permease [Chachezhania sediminis]